MMIVLGIESTCDETACSLVKDGKDILSNVVSSQIESHKNYGGVVPELASRRHIECIIPVIQEALDRAGLTLAEVDLIAIAQGPGLMGALLVGLNTAKGLALALKKPLLGVNHVEAHLYAALMSHEKAIPLPSLGVVISGGHTTLLQIEEIGSYRLIGQSIDDAIGEAFDKVGKILGLPYPGGPEIEKLAKEGDPLAFPFKAGFVKGKPYAFSFSGLKTSVLYTCKGQKSNIKSPLLIKESQRADVAASFQHTACRDVVRKTLKAAEAYNCKSLIFGGGVSNNQYIRELFVKEKPAQIETYWPSAGLSLDNAAMIAGLAYHYAKKGHVSDPASLEAVTRIPFD
jgi:N6-L-threonylcarbamoyladenine synthase